MAVDIIARGMAATADSNAEIARKISAPDYDPTETYNKNDIVFYNGKLYICTGTNVTGVFDPAKWSQIIISDELTAVINRLAQIDNPMLIKGVVATVGDLPANAEPGWVYFVGQTGDTDYDEYVYTEDDGWQHIGSAKIIVDSELSLTSANPVENRVITAALNTKLKSIAAAEAFDPEVTYTTGDYMTLDGELFRCDPDGTSPYPNLFNIASATTGTGYQDGVCYYDSGTSGNIQTFITSNIAITGGTAYALTIRSNWPQVPQIEAAAFFDENNVEVGSRITFYGIPSYGLGTKNFTAPATAAYIRLCITRAGNYATETELRQVSTAKFVKTTIVAELEEKADASDLTSKQSTYAADSTAWDTAPTENSTKPVTSGGIYNLDIPGRLKSIAAAAEFDPSGTYTTGDYMTLDGELYRCDPNGSAIVIGDNLFGTYSERLKNSSYGYINNKVYGSDGFHSNADTFYISGTIPLTSNASYRIVTPSYTKYNNIVASCALSSYENGNSPMNNPNTIIAYSSDGSAKTLDITATKPYLVLSVYKANEGDYAVYAVTSAKFVKTTITDELDTKQDALTFDTTPTADSNNPVTSNGIKLALDAKVNYDDIPTVSKAEYEAIGTEKYTNHKIYFIPDGDDVGANVQIFGWHVNPSESDPEDCVTYLEDAVGMTPASMGTTTFDYGSWQNAFFMPRPCMVKSNGKVDYYLDPNDYTKKLDGTASDIADASYDGNAMMEWPLIWWKYVAGEAEGEGSFYVSNVKIDNTYDCYCNVNCDNQIVEHFYTAIYNGTGTSKLRSISGVALTNANGNGGTTYTQESDRAMANNTTAKTEWFIDVWADRMLINGLLILMGKSLNTQAVFGRGLDTGSQTAKEAYVTGTLNDKGLFWGNISAGTSGVKVFGMENWYSCVWHRTAGLISGANSQYAYKMTWGTYDGTTATGYNTTATGYKTVGTRPATGYFNKATFGQFGYLPVVTSASSASTYYCDYYYDGTGFALVGGNANSGAYGGASCVDLVDGAGVAYWRFAAALTLKPLT